MIISLRRLCVYATCSFTLVGCVSYTPTQVQDQLNQWNNVPLETLIGVLGVPAKQYVLDDKRYVEWVKTEQDSGSSRISVGTGTGGRGWFSALGVSLPIESTPDTCAIRATTVENDSTVSKLDWQGDKNFCGEWLSQLNQPNTTAED